MAAVHLDCLFRADPSCTAFIEVIAVLPGKLRKHAVIQDVIADIARRRDALMGMLYRDRPRDRAPD